MDAKGSTEPCKIPTMHQLSNYVESTRKRLKFIEDIDGPSKCSQFLQQLQVNHVAKKTDTKNTRGASTCIVDSEDDDDMDPFAADPSENDAMETEEAILERQVELITPAKAKEAAEKIIRARKQVTFLEKPAITTEQTAIVEEEPAKIAEKTPPPPQEKSKEIWKPVKPRVNTKPAIKSTEQERSCWLYIYN
jgi:hypothetical protein